MADDTDPLLAALEAAVPVGPQYPTHLLSLAEVAIGKKQPKRAAEIALRALKHGGGDPATQARGHRLLASLLPGYHIAMMNDARRNTAWDAALRAAIRPGMHILEIGTGAGMLALMAARAGAAKVVTCEKDPVAAALARDLVARNGYDDRIVVIDKSSHELAVGVDLDRPADLLFCDIFGDKLLDFDPLPALADARQRLLAPGAPVMPARGMLRVALAHWDNYWRAMHIDSAAGFDLAPLADFAVRTLAVDIGDPTIRLLSHPQNVLAFDFAAASHPESGRGVARTEGTAAGEANGIARWIRLELDGRIALEACPEPGAVFFSRLNFCPLPKPAMVEAGREFRIEAAFRGKQVETWLGA
ncbi:MAG TPA: 50S ribosomal protein L11 methyltransferase [Rhizomicrobium sp.]|jgi:type II protein arginine methyltransferase|nr:50S ribosomal protein L11 methyltransferase [Rhizomicrobium sp.]